MSRSLATGLLAFGLFLLAADTSRAQQPYWQRATNTGTANGAQEWDPFRPYGARADARRSYSSRYETVAPSQVAPRSAGYSSQRHNYFPGAATGLYPNRNYVSPRTLCVPGRHAFMYR